jgi:hypothetical protein
MTVAARQPGLDMKDWRSARMSRLPRTGPVALPNEEEAMANQSDPNTEKSEMRVMWISSIVIVLLLLAAMGINMLITHDTGAGSSTEASSQSGAARQK